MKKNISINISGIIFHIEEDGYENLRKYLDSINRYFSSFEDSSEILADIESRIAEIFLSKLNEGKQVITAEDVHSLIATMGSVSDFKAAEEQEFGNQTENTQSATAKTSSEETKQNTSSAASASYATDSKRLLRDQKRKILGGVCSGLANYFRIDAVWIRLLFALLTFAYGITLVIYLVMWIIVPGSYELEEPETGKKMFRDGDRKVLGGVAGGVAAFLGMDIVVVRVLFVVFTCFFGTGLIIYLVLWIVLPEAKSLTDRMQMQGEPVTLSNIESNIKKNLNVDETKDESALTKIILFPFRVIGVILSGLAKMIVPIIEILRVAIGIVVIGLGLAMIFTAIISGGILVGLLSLSQFSNGEINSFPIHLFTDTFPGWLGIAGFIAAMIPGIFIILLGVSAIAKKIVFTPAVGWTLFVLFFVSVALLAVGIPKIVYANKEEGVYKVENLYPINGHKPTFKIREAGLDDYHGASIHLKGYDGKEIKVVQEFSSQGTTRQAAIDNAKMIDYHYDVQDSVFTFDSNISFKENAKFHGQELEMTLYIPYDSPFVLTEDLSRNRLLREYIDGDYSDGHTWRMTPRGLDCLSCPVADNDPETHTEAQEDFDFTNFTEIDINGAYDLDIRKGDKFAVEFTGSSDVKNFYEVSQEENKLNITFNGDWADQFFKSEKVKIKITLPKLERLEARGLGKVEIDNFDSDELRLDISGKIKAFGKVNTEEITINLSGASELELEGKSKTMEASVDGASTFSAYDFIVKDATVEVHGASSAKVNVTESLDMEERYASKIKYKGNPKIKRWD
jgi:phage shock protein PspC (stress-responsive transcriptional regulator)